MATTPVSLLHLDGAGATIVQEVSGGPAWSFLGAGGTQQTTIKRWGAAAGFVPKGTVLVSDALGSTATTYSFWVKSDLASDGGQCAIISQGSQGAAGAWALLSDSSPQLWFVDFGPSITDRFFITGSAASTLRSMIQAGCLLVITISGGNVSLAAAADADSQITVRGSSTYSGTPAGIVMIGSRADSGGAVNTGSAIATYADEVFITSGDPLYTFPAANETGPYSTSGGTSPTTATAAAGSATVSGAGQSTARGTGSAAAGVATVGAAGRSTKRTTGTASAGVATTSAVGRSSTASAVAAAVGAASVSGAGMALSASVATAAAGAAVVSAVTAGGAGSTASASAGVASVSAAGAAKASATASIATGSAVVIASGLSRAASNASAAGGLSTVSAAGGSLAGSIASAIAAAGASAASAIAASLARASGLTNGLATVSAVGSGSSTNVLGSLIGRTREAFGIRSSVQTSTRRNEQRSKR